MANQSIPQAAAQAGANSETRVDPTPLRPGDRVVTTRARRPGRVVKTYSDGSACICWDEGTPQPEGLGHERVPGQFLELVATAGDDRDNAGESPNDQLASAQREIFELKDRINAIDAISQEGFGAIKAVSNLLLLALEHPRGHTSPELLVDALQIIRFRADETENLINCEAEDVGANYEDPARVRLYEAFRQAMTSKVAAGSKLTGMEVKS